jgi:DNA replication protein DnaC
LTPDAKGLQLGPGKNPERKFEFDAVLGQNTQQEEVYDNHAKMAIDWFMKGFNSTIFAYGQSGSGKTYSMVGPEEVVEQLMKNCQNIPEQVA